VVMSTWHVVRVMPRDRRDYIFWIIKRRRCEEVLTMEKLEAGEGGTGSELAKTDAH
jgi:hypothetical protein